MRSDSQRSDFVGLFFMPSYISKDKVVAYFSDGSIKELGDRKSLLPKGVKCNQDIPPEVEEV